MVLFVQSGNLIPNAHCSLSLQGWLSPPPRRPAPHRTGVEGSGVGKEKGNGCFLSTQPVPGSCRPLFHFYREISLINPALHTGTRRLEGFYGLLRKVVSPGAEIPTLFFPRWESPVGSQDPHPGPPHARNPAPLPPHLFSFLFPLDFRLRVWGAAVAWVSLRKPTLLGQGTGMGPAVASPLQGHKSGRRQGTGTWPGGFFPPGRHTHNFPPRSCPRENQSCSLHSCS